MNRHNTIYFCGLVLLLGLVTAEEWAYWREKPENNAWIAEPAEQIVSSASSGQELHVSFILRNVSPRPRRILGVEAC